MSEPVTHRGALPPGTQVREFEFRQVLGHGGFGITYRGLDTVLQKTVAIKEYMPSGTAVRESDRSVQPKSGEDEKDYKWGLDRFLDEARMLARFDHPGIVRVQQFFEAHGTAYIAMEYLQGRTLAALYKDEKVLDEQRLRALLTPVLDALEQVHAAEFLHRDIKPGNIMYRNGDTPVLIDFGAARAAMAMRSQNMTAIVTPGFSPIEQYSTSAEIKQGPWTDIYAIGAVLYHGMTGTVPSDATARTMDDHLVPVREAAAGRYGEPLTDAVDWALRMRGAERPQSIEEWREVLEEGRSPPRPLAGHPSAGEAPANRGAGRSFGKGQRIAAVLGLAAVLAVGGVAYWWDELMGPGSFLTSETGPPEAERTRVLGEQVSEVRALLGRGEILAARELLGEAREGGLGDGAHGELEAAIGEAEARLAAEARAAEVRRLLEVCAGHGAAKRLAEALACYRQVLALEPGHAEAAAAVRRLEPLVAWKEVSGKDTVEGYYGFERAHEGSLFARLARHRLEELEASYWKFVQEAGTAEAYGRYLEIYPEGRFAALARRRAPPEE